MISRREFATLGAWIPFLGRWTWGSPKAPELDQSDAARLAADTHVEITRALTSLDKMTADPGFLLSPGAPPRSEIDIVVDAVSRAASHITQLERILRPCGIRASLDTSLEQ
jgi:hypothetical protein